MIADGRNYNLYGWSPNGNDLVISKWNYETQKAEVWLLSIASGLEKQKIAASPDYFLFQGQLSPDGRWMAFEAIRERPDGKESTIYAVSSAGGPWIRVTDGQQWDDKPRWSPDGNTMGEVVGAPFRLPASTRPSDGSSYISEVNLLSAIGPCRKLAVIRGVALG